MVRQRITWIKRNQKKILLMKFTPSKQYIALLISFCFISAFARQYHPFPTAQASWKIGRCWYFFPPGWYDQITVTLSGDDTLINFRSYKKLLITYRLIHGGTFDSSYTRILGGMREDDRKIYIVSEEFCLDTLERVIYDFGDYTVGDTIRTDVLTNAPPSKVPHVVTAIDSVRVGTAWHRRIHLSDTSGFASESWIEGVGSNWGLPYATYWMLTDNSYDLVCFNHLGGLKYQNPSPAYGFCTPPLPEITCDTGTLPPSGCFAGFNHSKRTDTVSFSGTSSHISVTHLQWSFGDGTFSSAQNPQHIYSETGWYEACLSVTGMDSSGAACTAAFCDSIYISDGCIDSSLICPPWPLCCDAPLYEPVCGCDSVTYDNVCQAALWHGVLHYTQGPCVTAVHEKNNALAEIILSPNPVRERVTIDVFAAEKGSLSMTVKSLLGQTLMTRKIRMMAFIQSFELNLSKVPAGIYFVEINLNGKGVVRKFVKE